MIYEAACAEANAFHRLALDDVARAHRLVEEGRADGKIILTVAIAVRRRPCARSLLAVSQIGLPWALAEGGGDSKTSLVG